MSGAIDWSGPSRQECPSCSRSPKDRTCGVTVEHDGRGVAHCFRCEYVETLHGRDSRVQPGRILAAVEQASKHETLSEFGRALWAACSSIAGEARAYLEARGCVLPPADGDLRWHPALRHPPSGIDGPALVALGRDAITGRPLTIHRTWTQADGTKAPFDPPRMLLGGHRKAGAVVRLWPNKAVTTGIGIAEGIETALSLAHAIEPVWACLDAGNLGAFPVLPGVESLTIAADNDPAGVKAARACADRWIAAGREVRVVMPGTERTDINDLARAA